MNMNIFKINLDKIYSEFWYQTYYKKNKIIFLMSQKTLDFVKDQISNSIHFTEKDGHPQLFFHNIAIADWLFYGDVKIVNEC